MSGPALRQTQEPRQEEPTTLDDYDLEGYQHDPIGNQIDREIAEADPCEICGSPMEYQAYRNKYGYRAFSVCQRAGCRHAVEF